MKFFRLLLVPPAFICVFIVRLLARFGIIIRFGEFISARMGHLAGNTECYLCEKDKDKQKYYDIWTHSGPPASKQLEKMISRVVFIDRTGISRFVSLCNSLLTGNEKHSADSSQMDRDIYNLFEKYPPHLSFTREEVNQGEIGLRRLGIPPGAKWVYLIVRDAAKHPQLPYHSYRNADIKNYAPAAQYLADRGYYVIRVGAKVLHPFPIKHPRIIDLSSMEPYDDFMSVFLGAKCEFCISTSTGPDAIPYIFRRPIVYTDFAPVEYLFTFSPMSLAIWKHHEKDGKRMTFQEIIDSKAGHFMATEQFERAGITLIPNTPAEILEVVSEMADAVEEVRSMRNYMLGVRNVGLEAQEKFWDKFPKSNSMYNDKPLHGEIRMRIGSEFLKGYQ